MRAIVGTAGHIDHGKSALVRALTGMETDRLREEQERGISIELGFAYLDIGGGDRAGIVDVPGHERFIRQMLAGAQGFDLVLVVVAADDGVMPQTEEHFEIVHLLGVERAIFVITKSDTVAPERVEEVEGEIEILVSGTQFEGAPVLSCSSLTGAGIEELRSRIISELQQLATDEPSGPLRIPVDRCFLIKGHGLVVTGTALSGTVAPGDEIEVLPGGIKGRVRDVQVHGEHCERACAGQRVALNLVGPTKEQVGRGATIATPGVGLGSERFDALVEVRPMAGASIKSHQGVRVYLGTAEVAGRIIWLDGTEVVGPRSKAFAQLALRESIVAGSGDRFVLRDETASRTLGGGTVVLPQAHRHRKAEGPLGARLEGLLTGTPSERVVALLQLTLALGLDLDQVALTCRLDRSALLDVVCASEDLVLLPDATDPLLVVAATRYAAYLDSIEQAVMAFHAEKPSAAGIELEHLRGAVRPSIDSRVFRAVVEQASSRGRIQRRGSLVRSFEHEVSLGTEEEESADAVMALLKGGGTTPPSVKQLEEELGLEARILMKLLAVLTERGSVVKVAPDLFFDADALAKVRQALTSYLEQHGEINAGQFRDLISASRKYGIPLLDFFDRTGVTLRVGDMRRLRAG